MLETFIDIRVFYQKTGRVKYISHLDINRCMQRTIKRSKLPAWYTQGFNPHLYLTFALPLSLGYESEYEIMDMRLTEKVPYEEVQAQLNRVLPEGLVVFRVADRKNKVEQIASADYEVRLYGEDLKKIQHKFQELMSEPWIEVQKKTKKGMKTVDIKGELLRYQIVLEKDCILIQLSLPAGSKNINPMLYIDEFSRLNPGIVQKISVLRKAIKDSEGCLFE